MTVPLPVTARRLAPLALALALLAGASPVGALAPVAPAATPAPTVVDVAALPLGRAPRVDHLADGVLRHRDHRVATDLPATLYPAILGDVDGRAVVTASQLVGQRVTGNRFWSVDASGHARRLGGTYPSYGYAPELVEATGHLWVQYEDRTTARTLWEVDARTGRELGVWKGGRVPHGLPAPDQALVDAWVAGRSAVPDTEARSGALTAGVRSRVDGSGNVRDTLVVRQIDDRSVIGRFVFPSGEAGGVERVVFEGRRHVLALVSVSLDRRGVPVQAIVRCSLVDRSCERATDLGQSIALGVTRPRFAS